MFIMDIEQSNNGPTLEQWLRDRWASLKARLRAETGPDATTNEAQHDQEYPESLIL